jgi:hypothetical protein
MLRRLWQWLKRFFGKLSGSSPQSEDSAIATPTQSSLSDADYEYLYMQLLEGVARGWQADRIDRFFVQLGDRGKTGDWLDWLNRFGDRLLSSATPHPELTTRMLLLAQHCEPFPKRREIGRKSAAIAQDLQRSTQKQYPIWEYDGPDSATASQPQAISLDELLERLQKDQNWAKYIAQQFGLDENSDPEIIIQAFMNNVQREVQRRQNDQP